MFAAKSVLSTIFVLAATFIALFVMFQVLGERAVLTAIPSIVITASVVSGVIHNKRFRCISSDGMRNSFWPAVL